MKEKHKQVCREMVNFTCKSCKKHEDQVGKLEPHRIRPRDEGGKYEPNNILMVCHTCHEVFSSAQRLARGIQ